jgi:hypothetical protein
MQTRLHPGDVRREVRKVRARMVVTFFDDLALSEEFPTSTRTSRSD